MSNDLGDTHDLPSKNTHEKGDETSADPLKTIDSKDFKPKNDELEKTKTENFEKHSNATKSVNVDGALSEVKAFAEKSDFNIDASSKHLKKKDNSFKKLFSKIEDSFFISIKTIVNIVEYYRSGFVWGLAIILSIILFYSLSVFERFELDSVDQRFKMKKNIPISNEVVIAEINDDCKKTFEGKGAWPWSRKIHASLIKYLNQFFSPDMIAFDILFLGPSGDKLADIAFSRMIKKSQNVYLPLFFSFSEDEDKTFTERIIEIEKPFKTFYENVKGTGHINFKEDLDRIVRRVPLLIPQEDRMVPHLALKMVLDRLGVDFGSLKVIKGKSISFTDKNNKDYVIPIDDEYQMILAWPGKWVDTFNHVSAYEVLLSTHGKMIGKDKTAIDMAKYKNSIFIVGDTTTASVDVRPTPYDKRCPLVNVHAVVISQILKNFFIKTLPVWVNIIVCLLIAVFVSYVAVKYNPLHGFFIVVLAFVSFYFFSVSIFIYFNTLTDLVRPLLTIIVTYLILGTYSHVRFKNHVDLKLSFEQKLSMADARLPQFKHNLKIGQYSNISELGRGGMAIVYQGIGKDGRWYAIKVINPEILAKDKLYKYRFKREIMTMKKVIHPNVIRVYDSGSYQGVLYYAMELFRAGALDDHVKELSKITDWEWLRSFFLQLIDGLKAIHDVGLIHRDIKPANIMMNDEKQVKMADFGLAKQVDEGQVLTTVGQVLGTPAYLAPELCSGEDPGFAADIYAMGIVFYEIVAGYRPFQECTTMASLIQSKMRNPIPSVKIRRNDLPKGFVEVIDKMVFNTLEGRYSNCQDIEDDLNAIEI